MNLNENEAKRWQKLGPVFRRAIKYLIEITTLYQQTREPMEYDFILMEQAFIYAEILMELCNVCDATYYLFPEQSMLKIAEPGNEIYFTIDTNNKHIDDLLKRINFDKNIQKNIFNPKEIPIYDFETQCKYLDIAFNETIGTSYNTSMDIIFSIIENSCPAENDSSSLFVQRLQIISIASRFFSVSSEVVEKVLSGFSLSKHKLSDRLPFKPKQEYRASRRAFFEWNCEPSIHYAWSKQMAIESHYLLWRNIVFGNVPPEWRSDSVDKALNLLNNYVGHWFELETKKQFEKLGYSVLCNVKSIGSKTDRILVPSEGIGEIDIIAYSPTQQLLVICECKITKEGFDPVYFKDSLDDYVNSRSSYANKFRRKFLWVKQNLETIINALKTHKGFSRISVSKVENVMITFAPSFASYYISDFPCVSLAEFVSEHNKQGAYPYMGLDCSTCVSGQ